MGNDGALVQEGRAQLLQELIARRLLIPTGIRGLFGRGADFERIISGLERMLDPHCCPEGGERVHFPPLVSREAVRKTGYMDNFPQLCGSVHSFMGNDDGHAALVADVNAGKDWAPHLSQTDVVLTPSTCYPLYPTLTGSLPEGGRLFDMTAYCFRHEPSEDPARMQAFRMRESICLATPERVLAWRSGWLERAPALIEGLGLQARMEIAADPFFGRGGRLMRANQQSQALKFELVFPLWSEEKPTAIASFNYHGDHFTGTFEIHTHEGDVAHSGCLGFGLERIALSLFKVHGLTLERWPREVRARLWL